MTSIRVINLLKPQKAILVTTQAFEVVSFAAHGTNEVQPKVVDIGFDGRFGELGVAANAFPHGGKLTPARAAA